MRILNVRWTVLAVVLVGGLVLPSGAMAAKKKVYELEGSVKGDTNSVVSMKTVVKKGKSPKVKDFAWSGLDGFCDGVASGEQSGSFKTTEVATDDFRVFGPYDQALTDADVVDISGFVKKKGKKVTNGLIAVYFNDGLCSAPPLGSREFTAST
jgi:hypothetical protein